MLNELASAARVLVLAAHPDDEVIGFGAHLFRLGPVCTIVHVTDGAPENLAFAEEAGFSSRRAYAEARRAEALAAAAVAGIPAERCLALGVVDQQATRCLLDLTARLADLMARLGPVAVVTHPYEGGHPDHDATAFAARAAADRLGPATVTLLEFTSYHRRAKKTRTFEFLPGAGEEVATVVLDEAERRAKQAMYGCYRTQRDLLAGMPILLERCRRAPRYDFTAPPHQGELAYERYDAGMRGAEWVELARAALVRLAR